MINFFKKILNFGPSVNYAELINQGATLLDVRTQAEYKRGHIQGSVNIPLQTLSSSLGKLKKDRPVITCCASGMRSASAKTILKSAGFSSVINGGGWLSLNSKINK